MPRITGPGIRTRRAAFDLEMQGAATRIEREVGAWEGVTTAPHRFGGIELRLGRRELGHLHGDRLADFPFTVRVRDELLAEGRVERHHVLPDSGWASRRIDDEADVDAVIELFALQYARATRAVTAAGDATAAQSG